MKILVGILLIVTHNCLAIPVGSAQKQTTREISAASKNGSNTIETFTRKQQNLTGIGETTIATRKNVGDTEPREQSHHSIDSFHGTNFKFRVLDLTKPTKNYETKDSQVAIDSPLAPATNPPHIGEFPQVHLVEVPHYIIVKGSDFPTGGFQAFLEISSLIQDFSNENNAFENYQFQPIEIAYPSIEQYPVFAGISGQYPVISEIPVIPGIENVPHDLDFGGTSTLTDESTDEESDSITVEALGGSKNTFKKFNAVTKRTENDGNTKVVKNKSRN